MSRPIVVIGAGGFGRETLDVIEAINRQAEQAPFSIEGVIDTSPSDENLERLRMRRVPYLGDNTVLHQHAGGCAVVAIGAPATRRRVVEDIRGLGFEFPTLIHPLAGVGSKPRIGAGAVICAGVQLSTNVSLGEHVHVNPNATIGHDAQLGDFVSLNPGAIISGDVRLGVETLIGAGAVVLQQLVIGARATVGAAACVVSDVPDNTTVKGIPAR